MKRLLVTAAACLLSLALLGCAPSDQAVLTVNGAEVVTDGDLQDHVDAVADSDDFLAAYDARGVGAETISTSFVASVLNFEAYAAVLADELADEGIPVAADDRSAAEETVTQLLENGDQATGTPPIQVDKVPDPYFEMLVDLYANFIALANSLSDDQQEAEALAQERFGELLPEAEVEVNERYGSWDSETLSVTTPEGPVSATSLPVATVPAG